MLIHTLFRISKNIFTYDILKWTSVSTAYYCFVFTWNLTRTILNILSPLLFYFPYMRNCISEGEIWWGAIGSSSAILSLLVLGQRRGELCSDQLLCNWFSFLPCHHWCGSPEGCFPGSLEFSWIHLHTSFRNCQCWGI